MASIDKRPGSGYRARWREYPGGPQKTRQFARKGDAERFLNAVRGDLARGVYIDPAGERTLFRDYAESWRVAQMHRPSTAAQAESYLRLRAYPTLGRRPPGAIRRSEIQGWVGAISSTLAPGSVEVTYRRVASIFKAAVADRLIAASPCVRIALPKRTDTELVPLGVGQVADPTAAVPLGYRALIVFAAGTGLRQGECFGLSLDRVDFLRRTIRVDRLLTAAKGGVPTLRPPKSKAGVRPTTAEPTRRRPGRWRTPALPKSRRPMVLRTLATGESPHGGAVDGMFVARAHGQDLPGTVIDLSIDEPNNRGGHQPGTSTLTRTSPERSPLTWRRPRSLPPTRP